MVFTLIMGTGKLKAWCRMGILVGVSLYALSHGRWDAFLFVNGTVLAELRYVRAAWTVEGEDMSIEASKWRVRIYWVFKREFCSLILS